MLLDNIILEKSNLISYSKDELSNIAATSNHLRGIINNENDFLDSLIQGSYKRGTMVKGISDVDIYYQYIGTGSSQNALARLKTCLTNTYTSTTIKQDRPSILVDFNRIPFNITPFKKDISGSFYIPDNTLTGWKQVRFGELESLVQQLRGKNSKLIDLIKILKLWNYNYKKNLKNFEIEVTICNRFLNNYISSTSITDWLWTFFNNNGYTIEANKVHQFMLATNESFLKTEWLKFIDKK